MSDGMDGSNDESENRGGTDGTTGQSRDPLTLDVLGKVFDLLRAPRRRYLLYFLYGTDDANVPFDEAVEAVRAYEGAATTMLGSPSRQSIRADLFHVQFPRLAEAGVVEVDHENEEIRVNDCAPLEEWLARAHRLEFE